jgi:hypothetical protein
MSAMTNALSNLLTSQLCAPHSSHHRNTDQDTPEWQQEISG